MVAIGSTDRQRVAHRGGSLGAAAAALRRSVHAAEAGGRTGVQAAQGCRVSTGVRRLSEYFGSEYFRVPRVRCSTVDGLDRLAQPPRRHTEYGCAAYQAYRQRRLN